MKKLFAAMCTIILLGSLITACGPSAKEIESRRVADSTKVADSLAGSPSIDKNLSLNSRTPNDRSFIKTAETRFLVGNVRHASEKIEDLAAKYSGFVTYSKLSNHDSDISEVEISRDSSLALRKIIVTNDMILRIPNENLDSLVRELNRIILFLDYRIITMDDVTFTILANQRASDRLQKTEMRQQKHIDTKQSKLKEAVAAEETVLGKQSEADKVWIENQVIADQVKYCTLTIHIYQKPVYFSEMQVIPNPEAFKPNLFKRILDAMIDGWLIAKYIIVFLFRIWWLFVFCGVVIIGYKLWTPGKK